MTVPSFNILIVGLKPDLNASVSDIKVGENAIVNIEINPQVSGNVVLTFGNTTLPAMFINGKSSVIISNLSNGTHEFLVKFDGDSKFLADNISLKVNVFKNDISKDINITTIIPEGTTASEFIIKLPKDCTGIFTVKINGTTYTQNLVNGFATIKCKDLSVGSHQIVYAYSGDDKYGNYSFNSELIIPKVCIPGGENVINMTSPEGSATPSYMINLSSDATGNLTVMVDGKDNYTKALVNGSAIVDVPILAPGMYNITVTYTGDSKYMNISIKTNLTVDKVKVNLKANTSNIKVGEKAVVDIEIDSEVSGKVVLICGNETFPVRFINGKSSVILPDLSYGAQDVIVKFDGDNKFLADNVSLKVNVLKYDISKDINITTNIPEGTASPEFTIKLPNDVDGLSEYDVTLTGGFPTFDVPKLTPGKHGILVTYSGDDKYLNISKSNEVMVNAETPSQLSTKIIASNKVFKSKLKVKKYAISLKSVNGVVSKAYMILKINGKIYHKYTNINRRAIFKIKKLTKKRKIYCIN